MKTKIIAILSCLYFGVLFSGWPRLNWQVGHLSQGGRGWYFTPNSAMAANILMHPQTVAVAECSQSKIFVEPSGIRPEKNNIAFVDVKASERIPCSSPRLFLKVSLLDWILVSIRGKSV